MAKRTGKAQERKSLVIVESPTKARTIRKYLGPEFVVEASIGHVRDLPEGRKEVPAEYKHESWANLGVNVQDNFKPLYIVPPSKKKQVAKLRKLLKESRDLYLATDEDREGEAISWHLCQLLQPKVPVHRLVFHEITEEAIREALEHPRQVDERLVRAQEARRILDRLYGYEVSPLLWRKIRPGLSAGRVQSVAVRLIVERERERRAFIPATFWDALGHFLTVRGDPFTADLVSVDGKRLATGRDFDARGQIKDPELLWFRSQDEIQQLLERLGQAEFRVVGIEEKPYSKSPPAPFTTSTLQQEAHRKLGFTAKRTMLVAQSLYEKGYITYMRTDSTHLADVAIEAARELIRELYGPDYLPAEPRIYRSQVKNAQEAHEAIRPAGHPFQRPEAVRSELSDEEFRLFELIWKRTIASQMVNSRERTVTVTIEGAGAQFQAKGKSIDFPGFLRAYVEGSDDPDAELAGRERLLPVMQTGEPAQLERLETVSHTTQPPPRYNEASLTRKLEEMGIGRPSTYASIIDTILARDYVYKKNNALVPTWTAFCVSRFLEENLAHLVDYQFTAQMEDSLDAISRGEAEHLQYLRDFYFGNQQPGLKPTIEQSLQAIDAREVTAFELGAPQEGPHRDPVVLRVGRYGPYLEQGKRGSAGYRRASVPAEIPPDELTLEKALQLLEQAEQQEKPLGFDPHSGKPIYVKKGRFGPYVQLGDEGDEKPKTASLLKGMKPEELTVEVALKLLELPRTLGEHPETGEPIVAANGRWGPYVKCGSETRTLPAELSPFDVTLEKAVELLTAPKAASRRRSTPEVLQTFGPSPHTQKPVQLLAGRYGPYVTDGEVNATLPKDLAPESVTEAMALELLQAKRQSAPGKRKSSGRRRKKTNGTQPPGEPDQSTELTG
ncbi:MAG: DNA topoisomerase 1 [Pirellulaceae bacterium]|nr:MAG: DNA topoisomerase 1 [Pirellulaceae bacterium]